MFDIKNLNEDYFLKVKDDELIDIKNLSLDDKIACFKFFLNSKAMRNYSVISNIFILINGITELDQTTFDDERFFFNGLEEYVDIKLGLKEDIKNFGVNLIQYYLGIIKGLNVRLDELKTHIPNTYFCIFNLLTPELLSSLMNKYLAFVDVTKVTPAHCSKELYTKINDNSSLLIGFLESLMQGVKKDVIES